MRNEQYPSWLVEGLLRQGQGSVSDPDAPLGKSSYSYNSLKARIKELLQNSEIGLRAKEISAGTYWLVERIFNQIGEDDTDQVVAEYVDRYVGQYLADKAMAALSGGQHQRSPIYDREWWETYYNKGKLKRELTEREKGREKGEPESRGKELGGMAEFGLRVAVDRQMVYVGIDGDDIGSLVEETLRYDDPEKARQVSMSIHDAHKAIRKVVKDRGGKIIFDGGDNMFLFLPLDNYLFEELRRIYVRETGHTATVGVGSRPVEAHYALVVGKNTGKDRTVVYSPEVEQMAEEIKRKQQALAPIEKQLKYKAESESGVDIKTGEKLKGALWELGIQVTDELVYDILLRLVERFGLDSMDHLVQYFDQDRETLKQGVREVYARRATPLIREATQIMSGFEIQEFRRNLAQVLESAIHAEAKMGELAKTAGDIVPGVQDALRGLSEAKSRLLGRAGALLNLGQSWALSEDAGKVRGYAAEASSMLIPLTQSVDLTFKALDNAQMEHLGEVPRIPVDPRQVIHRIADMARLVNETATCVDMVILMSRADPHLVERAAAEERFPGHAVIPGGRGQRSPHKRLDWQTREEMNRDQVDWTRTDVQYVGGNHVQGDMGDKADGGDPGPAVYIP